MKKIIRNCSHFWRPFRPAASSLPAAYSLCTASVARRCRTKISSKIVAVTERIFSEGQVVTIILLFIFATSSPAMYVPVEDTTPKELAHIVTELQSGAYYRAEPEKVEELIRETDSYLGKIDKEDAEFLIKTVIYKTLLSRPPSKSTRPPSKPPGRKELARFLEKVEKMESPFLVWMGRGIHRDLKSLVDSPRFASYLQGINKPEKWNTRLEKMKRKFKLLLPWYAYLTSKPSPRRNRLTPVLLECLETIRSRSIRYALFLPDRTPETSVSYFSKQAPKETEDTESKLGSIVDPVIEKHLKHDLPLPVDDWIPKPHERKPAGQKIALPEPIDDWIPKDTTGKLPSPSPEAKAKAELPKPTDDWIVPE